MARGSSGPAYHSLLCNLPPLWRGPSSERALRRRPSYHLPFVSFTHLYGARPERASFSLPFCPIMARGPSRPAYHCLSVQFAPVMARLAPVMARLRSERSVGSQVIICLLLHLPTLWRAARAGQLFIALLPNFPPLWRVARAGQLIVCLSAQFAPVLACGRVGQLINALLLFVWCGPSGPAYHLRGPSGPVCHLPLCLLCGAPQPV